MAQRHVHISIVAFLLLAFPILASYAAPAPTDGPQPIAPVVLPVEVLGENGYTVSVTVDLPNASSVAGLWMQINNLSYDNKASVRINGGSWTSLTNNNTDVQEPERSIGGIGGGYSTIRLTLALSSGTVVNGANTIDFKFNETDGLSMGYRVLDFDFVNASGSRLLPAGTFVEEDPSTWQPIHTSSSAIAEGKDLWENASLTEPGQGTIQARCADCHASDGRDLKYFNYSDWSIIARSEFHGLSRDQGEKIASYIRNLDAPAHGRPWDPPYQPGPGLDDKPVEQWAAGAGLEWALDEDIETWEYLFPNGVTNKVASTKSTLNMRELPVALQFPDWNMWLPRIHPKDYWGSTFTNSAAYNELLNGMNDVLNMGIDNAVASGAVISAIQSMDSEVTDFRRNTPKPSGTSYEEQAQGNLGLQSLQLVKVWEIMQKYELEDKGRELYPESEDDRTWFSLARNLFNLAPHISGAGGSTVHTHGSEMLDKYFSHVWYQYQVVLNAGNRAPQEHRPVDWKYHFGHIGDFSKHTGIPSSMRMVASYIKMIQTLDNNKGIGSHGWYIRHSHPYWFVRSLATGWTTYGPIWDNLNADQQAQVAEVMIRSFMLKSMEYEENEWPRGGGNNDMEPENYKPVPYDGKGSIFEDRFNHADNIYRIAQVFQERGVSPAMLDSLAMWGEELWPNGDWENLVDYSGNGGGGGGGGGGGEDTPTVSLTLSTATEFIAREPGGAGNTVQLTLTRDGDLEGDLEVFLSFTGTAINGTDYTELSSPYVIPDGESEKKFAVKPIDDDKVEETETVIVSVQTNSAYQLATGANKVTVNIEDNDVPVSFAIGDTTGDGTVSALDAALILQHVANLGELSGAALDAADVSADDRISAYDASLVLQYITGLIDCFPASSGCFVAGGG